MTQSKNGKGDFISLADLSASQLKGVLHLASALKRGEGQPNAKGKSLVLLLEKPSLRTRVSFELAMQQMGGMSLSLGQQEIGLGVREPVADVARVLSRYASVVAARVFDHKNLIELAKHASIPIINALSDVEHPCQALADLLTIVERFPDKDKVEVAFIGDGNNVATSLAYAAAMLGLNLHVASPDGYQLPDAVVQRATHAAHHGARLRLFTEPADAVERVDAIYTDTWTSMGREAEAESRREAFAPYQVNEAVMSLAKPGALFMHCLPAHRGEEVTADVFESPASIVFDQAENRLHCQKALLVMLLSPAQA